MNIKMRGFTLFFAMLVGALALAVGLAIYDLTIRELDLSAAATQSQYAIYAADTGAECALYWDSKYVNVATNNNGGSNGVFATSSADSQRPGGGSSIFCNSQDVSGTSLAPWTVTTAVTSATTTFTLMLTPQAYCATVTVSKSGNPSQTNIVSNGFNTCTAGALQLERSLQVSY